MSGRAGDGFLRCRDGHVRWGRFGAAGAVFVTADDRRVMLQQRSIFAHEGGTWSCAGGALDEHESALDGAIREAQEEVGTLPQGWRVVGETVFAPADDWTYTTFVIAVSTRFGESLNFETDAVGWFTADEVGHLALHAGFAAAWPELQRLIDTI